MKLAFWRREPTPPRPVCVEISRLPEVQVRHVIRHEPRPPAPRPERITVVYEMQDGHEYKTFIPLHGQSQWVESWPGWLDPQREPAYPPVAIRYHIGYAD